MLSVPISAYFNNQAFGSSPGEADFDGTGQSYVAQSLKLSDSYQSPKSGIDYQLASYLGEGKPDNVICRGQTIPVSKGRYFSANLLVASDKLDTLLPSNITFTYSSNKTVTTELRAKPWWSILTLYKGDIILPSRFTTNGTDFNTTHIFEWTVPLLPSEDLVSVTFPNFTTGTRRIHVFSMSLLQVTGVQVQYVRPTQKSKDGRQLVEIGIDNAGPDWVSGPGLNVSLSGSGITTVEPGFVKRLRPGDQKRVVLVVSGQGISDVEVSLDGGNISCTASFTGIDFGLKEWTSDLKSLNEHESPEWFNGAKYGIFIHWVGARTCIPHAQTERPCRGHTLYLDGVILHLTR